MIISFGNKETQLVWTGKVSGKLPFEIQNTARRKLRMINNAHNLQDLKIPPANRLKRLHGDLSDFHSIRINRQWRIIFKWVDGQAHEVQIVDYH